MPNRMSNRGAGLTARLAILLAAAGALLLLLLGSGADAGTSLPATKVHVVHSGETLWSIAGSLAAPTEDRRSMVKTLRELNDLEGGFLTVGQRLVVPAD